MFGKASPEYFAGRCANTSRLNRHHLLLLQKVLGETLPVFPCLVLCVVDTAILVVLSAGEQNLHSVGLHVLHQQPFNAVYPVIYFACLLFRGFAYEAAEVA